MRGQNTKSIEAKARRREAEEQRKEAEKKAKEDAQWIDNNKNVKRKFERKQNQVQKAEKKALKKSELKNLYEQEEKIAEKHSRKAKGQPVKKVTQHEIMLRLLENLPKETKNSDSCENKINFNDLSKESYIEQEENILVHQGGTHICASNIDDALAQLELARGKVGEKPDLHPEKRAKALYLAFEEEMYPILKAEYPHLRRSQLKEKIWNEWKTSPKNPLFKQ